MKVDSPRFSRKSDDDSGDDNKSSKYHYPSEASIRMASLNESDIEELADEVNDDTKSYLFEDSTQANFKYFDGKFFRGASDFHIQGPSDDEVYFMLHPTLPMPTSRTYKRENIDEGDVMPYNNLSSSSGPSAYHLPLDSLEKELSRDTVRGSFSLSHASESSTQSPETNLRNAVSFLEQGDAGFYAVTLADDVMSDSTFGTVCDTSISALFSNLGTDPLTNKDLPLRLVIASEGQLEASKQRRILDGGKLFPCSLCPQSFTAKHNLKSKSPTLQIFVALALISVFQTTLTLITVTKTTHAMIVEVGSLLRVLFIGIAGCASKKRFEVVVWSYLCRQGTLHRSP